MIRRRHPKVETPSLHRNTKSDQNTDLQNFTVFHPTNVTENRVDYLRNLKHILVGATCSGSRTFEGPVRGPCPSRRPRGEPYVSEQLEVVYTDEMSTRRSGGGPCEGSRCRPLSRWEVRVRSVDPTVSDVRAPTVVVVHTHFLHGQWNRRGCPSSTLRLRHEP